MFDQQNDAMTEPYKYKAITEQIIGAAMKVHNTLGCGFQEVIFQRELAIEFSKRKLSFKREFCMQIYYDEMNIGSRRVDFFIEGKIMLEIKAISTLEDLHLAQSKNYLQACNLEIGLLINFGAKRLEFHRMINTKVKPSPSS